MSSACSHPACPAWPPWQLGTLFLESSQLNLTTVPVEQLCLALRKENQVLKTLARPPEISPSFWENNTIKIRILLPQFLHTFSFSAFPDKLHPQRHSCLVLCCVSLSPRHPLLSQAHSSPAAAPDGEISSCNGSSHYKGLGGWSNPWLTSTAFPGDAGGRGRTLSSAEISQHRKESKSCCNVWVAKHESFPSLDHAFLPWNQMIH